MGFKWFWRKKKPSQQQQQQQPPSQPPTTTTHDDAPVSNPSLANTNQPQVACTEDLEELKTLKQFKDKPPVQCAGCSRSIELNSENVTRSVQRWRQEKTRKPNTDKFEMLCGLHCSNRLCGAITCPCGSRVSSLDSLLNSLDSVPQMLLSGEEVVINHCCSKGRDIVVWAVACATSNVQTLSSAWILSNDKESGSRRNAPGTGYCQTSMWHQLFTRKPRDEKPARQPSPPQNQELVMKTLEVRFRLMAALGTVAKLNSDMAFVAFMVARSDLLVCAADLLVNNSPQEIQNRYHLYDGLMSFLESLSCHPATVRLVSQPRRIFADKGRLNRLSFMPKDEVVTNEADTVDTGRSLGSILTNILPQSEKMLQYSKMYKDAVKGHDDVNLKFWNTRLVMVAQLYVDKAAATPIMSFAEYHRENAIAEVPDDQILLHHHYSAEATAAKNCSTLLLGQRMKRVVREITILQTSLPEGIFVRHGASRLDVLKVLIIGPKGTPYEDGFFLFDAFLPLNFPQAPPQFRFRTAGNGRTPLNPNLYPSGKVCLSLLGTWFGEPWRPAQSTLLQVLVSLQSMIFCADPYYNEPLSLGGAADSAGYNTTVRKLAVEYAIVPWIRATADTQAQQEPAIAKAHQHPNVDALWIPVAAKYFSGTDTNQYEK